MKILPWYYLGKKVNEEVLGSKTRRILGRMENGLPTHRRKVDFVDIISLFLCENNEITHCETKKRVYFDSFKRKKF
jgi:hypothetical protein